ncbi:BlaI/MecI/CopY family transcriptional regulator, partial [Staphylococcus aureus]
HIGATFGSAPYKGGFNSLVLNFVEKEDLSQDEIEELRNILNKK